MRKEIFTTYAKSEDMTFIMEDTYTDEDLLVSTECVGWYYGVPNEEDTTKYQGETKAVYEL